MDSEKEIEKQIGEAVAMSIDRSIFAKALGDLPTVAAGHTGTVIVHLKKEISKCYHTCPYFDLEGGPSPIMWCTHPGAPDQGYIISHPICDSGFPIKCPLFPIGTDIPEM